MEFVYVLKRYDLFDLSFPHGFVTREDDPRVEGWLERIEERGFFLERRRAEADSSFKQIIPYCVVVCGGEILLLHRFSTQAESRLHDKLSIGVGGHLDPVDGAGDLLEAGLRRELDEELRIETPWRHEAVGVINDESNDVGSVHFGIVYRIDLEKKRAEVRERDKMSAEFLTADALREVWHESRGRFESWSDLLLLELDRLVR
jgi:predicted NUDIX family phosphoesterase